MPVTIVAPTIVRYTFKHTVATSIAMDNILDVSIDAAILADRDATVDSFNTHICGLWQDNIVAHMSTLSHFDGATWIDLNSAGGRTGTLGPAGGHPVAGSNAGEIMSPQVSFLIHKQCDSKRGQRPGRMYVGPVQENAADGWGILTTVIRDAWTSYFTALKAGIEGALDGGEGDANVRVVHVKKPVSDDPSTWTWSSSTVNAFLADNKVATQRRRLVR